MFFFFCGHLLNLMYSILGDLGRGMSTYGKQTLLMYMRVIREAPIALHSTPLHLFIRIE